MKKYLFIIKIGFISIIILTLTGCNEKNQNYEIVTNQNNNILDNYNPFFSKKVILRDDDIAIPKNLPSLSWIVNLTIHNKMKLTLAIIPAEVIRHVEMVEYLNRLDRRYFEFATHGYTHIRFEDIPYEEQYNLINNATKIIEDYFYYRPYTFIPPYGSEDINTIKVLSDLGYHSITDYGIVPCYVTDFLTDIEYETGWSSPPPDHRSVKEIINLFNSFYNSSDEYFILTFHDWAFLDEEGNLNLTRVYRFEEIINYIISKNVQFMTIDEAYKTQMDKDVIKTEMINKDSYLIDLKKCLYNHTIKINPPESWNGKTFLLDDTINAETMLNETIDEFFGIKGHVFYLNHFE